MRYEIRMVGAVPPGELTSELAGLAAAPVVARESCIVVSVSLADEAALYGVLHLLWARRLQVVRVRQL